jgi:hypothetical protein
MKTCQAEPENLSCRTSHQLLMLDGANLFSVSTFVPAIYIFLLLFILFHCCNEILKSQNVKGPEILSI